MLPEVNTILYASSLGEHTRPVFRHAIKMAKAYDAKIIMVHALETVSDFVYEMVSYYLPSGQNKDFYKKEGEQRMLTKMSERVKLFYAEELERNPETVDFVSHFVVKKAMLLIWFWIPYKPITPISSFWVIIPTVDGIAI
ncbi:MAG: hypothetical protein V7745_02645 [Pseudomonadales bacterium]